MITADCPLPERENTQERLRQHVELACILEVSARKPGNVHPFQQRPNLTFHDFVRSGIAIGPVLAKADDRGFGQTVLDAIRATRQVCRTNTNLGIVLLLTPLCRAASQGDLSVAAVADVLNHLTVEDTRLVYQAIREAEPGGLGEVAEQDVHSQASVPLKDVMRLAADRDTIALQYANDFHEVLTLGLQWLADAFAQGADVESATIWCHLNWMAAFPDSLIARKFGVAEAEESARRAKDIINNRTSVQLADNRSVSLLNEWLVTRGQIRNPGTSADLVAASLFCAFEFGIPVS